MLVPPSAELTSRLPSGAQWAPLAPLLRSALNKVQGSVDAAAAEAEAKTDGLLKCWYVSKFVETAEEEHKFVLQDSDLDWMAELVGYQRKMAGFVAARLSAFAAGGDLVGRDDVTPVFEGDDAPSLQGGVLINNVVSLLMQHFSKYALAAPAPLSLPPLAYPRAPSPSALTQVPVPAERAGAFPTGAPARSVLEPCPGDSDGA